jgi:hypothetical protein
MELEEQVWCWFIKPDADLGLFIRMDKTSLLEAVKLVRKSRPDEFRLTDLEIVSCLDRFAPKKMAEVLKETFRFD